MVLNFKVEIYPSRIEDISRGGTNVKEVRSISFDAWEEEKVRA